MTSDDRAALPKIATGSELRLDNGCIIQPLGGLAV
jgi:hypothetical protein